MRGAGSRNCSGTRTGETLQGDTIREVQKNGQISNGKVVRHTVCLAKRTGENRACERGMAALGGSTRFKVSMMA